MKNKNRFVGLVVISALVSSNITPVMAWKISVPGVINTGVQIYQQTHKKSDGRVKAPANFNPRGVHVKSERDLDASLPQGDYFILLKPRSDIRLQPQETPWFRINKQTIAHIIVQQSGIRRVEFRIEGKAYSSLHRAFYVAQAARKFPVQERPIPANDNEIVPSEQMPASAGAGFSLRAIFADIAASAVGAAIFVGTALVAILPPNSTSSNDTMDGYNAAHPSPASQAQPEQNPRQQTNPDQCWDEEFPSVKTGKRPSQTPQTDAQKVAWREMQTSTAKIIDRFPADAKRLVALYGGKLADWARMAALPQQLGEPEIHWLENVETHKKVEYIFKNPCKIPKADCEELTGTNEITGKTTYFTAKNPGSLSYSVPPEVQNFANGAYRRVITNKWVRLYRVWGGDAPQFGGYWTRTPVSYEQIASAAFRQVFRNMFALPEAWNPMRDLVIRDYKPGTVMYVGKAAKQAAYPQYAGGGEQVFMDKDARENFGVNDCKHE